MLAERHGNINSRIARAYADINKTPNLEYKMDLLKLHKGINDLYAKLDNEMINCRVRQRFTPAYETLAKEIENRLHYVEKHTMWFKFM